MAETGRREGITEAFVGILGFLVGAAVGVAVFGGIGYRVFVQGHSQGIVGGLGFLVGFTAAVFALAAPFALGKFLSSTLESQVARDLLYGGSFLASFVVLVGMTLAGLYALQVYSVSEPLAALVVFDVVTGFSAGGMTGYTLAERALVRFRGPALAES